MEEILLSIFGSICAILTAVIIAKQELKSYVDYKQKFRLLILIPAILLLIVGTPIINYLPTNIILPIKIIGCIFVIGYYFYIAKVTKKEDS